MSDFLSEQPGAPLAASVITPTSLAPPPTASDLGDAVADEICFYDLQVAKLKRE